MNKKKGNKKLILMRYSSEMVATHAIGFVNEKKQVQNVFGFGATESIN